MSEEPVALPQPRVPLAEALCCLDCDLIYNVRDGHCPCGSRAALALVQVLKLLRKRPEGAR